MSQVFPTLALALLLQSSVPTASAQQAAYSREDLVATCRVLSNLARESNNPLQPDPSLGLFYSTYQRVKRKSPSTLHGLNCDRYLKSVRDQHAKNHPEFPFERPLPDGGGGSFGNDWQTLPPDAYVIFGIEASLHGIESGMRLQDINTAIQYKLSGINLYNFREQLLRDPNQSMLDEIRNSLLNQDIDTHIIDIH